MSCYVSFIVLLLIHSCLCEVHLKIIFRPPWTTLECVIHQPREKASAILMCPNDSMCFQNCDRLCSAEECLSNNITCSFEEMGSVKKFVYRFNASNIRNRGEWTCHYGTEKGSSAIFYVDNNPPHSKREIQVVSTTKITKRPDIVRENVQYSKKLIDSTTERQSIPTRKTNKPLFANVNPYYVIVLLIVFSISLLINVIFLVRDVLTSISTRKSINRSDGKKYSYWLGLCIKLFCVEKLYKFRQSYKENPLSNEINPLISRQVSSNLYECPPPIHIHPPILFENVGYAGSPANERMPFINSYLRSKSFPSKPTDPILYSNNSFHLAYNTNYSPPLPDNASTSDSNNQIIYDDVPEPNAVYSPTDNPLLAASLSRPAQRPGRLPPFEYRRQMSAMSMNNLNLRPKYRSESVNAIIDSGSESFLKDAINSRVELSKEMISHADTLLKQADDLLSRRDSPRDS